MSNKEILGLWATGWVMLFTMFAVPGVLIWWGGGLLTLWPAPTGGQMLGVATMWAGACFLFSLLVVMSQV